MCVFLKNAAAKFVYVSLASAQVMGCLTGAKSKVHLKKRSQRLSI